jgi:hypothetical protein
MEPINYSIDVKSPFDQAIAGYGAGAAIRNDQQQQAQVQLQQQRQQQMQKDLFALSSNKNAGAQDYAAIMTKYPEVGDHLKRSWDVLDADQQKIRLGQASQVFAATQSGNNDVALDLINKQMEAAKNSGDMQTYTGLKALADGAAIHPESLKTSSALMLSSILGPEKFASTYATLGDQGRAAQKAPVELAKTQEEINASQTKQKLDALDVQIRQADSETKRGELQLQRDKLQKEYDLKTQTAQNDAQSQSDGLVQGLATVDALMKHPGLSSGTGMGSSVTSFFNGTDAKDFRVQLETLKSQQFLTAAKELKGMGALSDAEGARLEKSIASLDPSQSTSQFKTNLGVIRSTLQKAQAKLIANGKLPNTGGGFVMKHPQYGNVTEGDINRLMTQNPGSTRDQILQFLKSTGGQ